MEIPSNRANEQYQERILPGVSRTFALTIPQLPRELRRTVTNGYLLCRIADTIEDEAALSVTQKQRFHERFIGVTSGPEEAADFARDLAPLLTRSTLNAERELIINTPRVIAVTRSLNRCQQVALEKCIVTMCGGMPKFQRNAKIEGISDLAEMDRYCYYVAGVVGEMLTELFCDYSAEIQLRRAGLQRLAVSFGQGLQMTNILKDIWDDRARGDCWLPRDIFLSYGCDLARLTPGRHEPGFEQGLMTLVGIAHRHLRNALSYTLLIPPNERGIRRFCLWAIGLAALTLRRIQARPAFTSGQEVKVSRRAVKYTASATSLLARRNALLTHWFNWTSRGLPLAAAQTLRPHSDSATEAGAMIESESFSGISRSEGKQKS